MPSLAEQLAALADRYVALREEAPAFTPESLCGAPGKLHRRQLAAVLDTARFIILLCSRRAGKTRAIAIRFLLRSLRTPGSNCIYIALTKPQARNVAMWEPIWKPMLRALGVACKHDETEMITTFPNGSTVRFTGASDVRVIETELGSAIDEVVIDECQSSPLSVLGPLVKRILPPALGDRRGTLILAGTIPEVDGGLFMDTWKLSNWSKHNWSQMDNPHMPDPMGELQEFLAANPGLTMDSPIIQRERFGRFVYDKNATAYMYDQALNGYRPELLPWADAALSTGLQLPAQGAEPGRVFLPTGLMMAAKPEAWVEWISFALDPASDSDRVSLQGIGWGKGSHRVQHLFDWTSSPGAKHTTSEMYAVAGLARAHYGNGTGRGVFPLLADLSGAKNVIDNVQRDFGIPVILPAKKGSLKDTVDRVNTSLADARLQIMIGSAVEEDFQKARRDPDAWARGQFRWAATWHPDASEALRYSLEHYFDAYEPPPARAPEETRGFEDPEAETPWFNRDLDELLPDGGTSDLY